VCCEISTRTELSCPDASQFKPRTLATYTSYTQAVIRPAFTHTRTHIHTHPHTHTHTEGRFIHRLFVCLRMCEREGCFGVGFAFRNGHGFGSVRFRGHNNGGPLAHTLAAEVYKALVCACSPA